MILVLSHSSYEQGTDPVIDWLLYYKASFIRVSMADLLTKEADCFIDVNNNALYVNGHDITAAVNVVFFRRWEENVPFRDWPEGWPYSQLSYESNTELLYLSEYLFTIFRHKKWLPPKGTENLNKLEMISRASCAGLKTPATAVINNKEKLLEFFHECGESIITKPVYNSGYFTTGGQTYTAFTTAMDEAMIHALPDRFFPTLFQERIKGDYEIRSFCLDGDFYSSAVFPDPAITAQVADVKIGNHYATNYWMPYWLPGHVENSLNSLMHDVGLNTGSFDLIQRDGSYYFLEVNPVGQFLAPGTRANYRLEQKIAEWLIKNDK